MGYPIHRKLVIAVASSALFDLSESHEVFRNEGQDAYRKYQHTNKDTSLGKGVAFSFIRRFLQLNQYFPDEKPVEVVLLSKNDPDTGQRVFKSIADHNLDITRAGFLNGRSPHRYIPAFNVSLFLSASESDVKSAINSGYPAGTVLPSSIVDDTNDHELRVAFDFDGVIADDEAESVYEKNDNVAEFQAHEAQRSNIPHNPGPLSDLFRKLAFIQKIESKRALEDINYNKFLRTAIVTARNAPANERVVTTLNEWGVIPDETFFLGGMNKHRVLEVLKPHIFFDDQMKHLESVAGLIPSVHIPFGIRNLGNGPSTKSINEF